MRPWSLAILVILSLALVGPNNCDKLFPFRNGPAPAPLAGGLSAATAAGGSPLPMLNAFPICQPTLVLDVSTLISEERVDFGAMSNEFRGVFACFPINNPVQISVTEGNVEVMVEAAAVVLGDPNPLTNVARFAIEGRSSITGGTASAVPSWLIQAGYLFPYAGSPTGNAPIRFAARLINANDTGGAAPQAVVAEVKIDCGVGEATVLPLDGSEVDVPTEPTSTCGVNCACTANATLAGGASAEAGEAVQRLTVIAFNTNGLCVSNEGCRLSEPANPFCVLDFGCSDGSVGMPCGHDSQCDDAGGAICAASQLCEDGSAGASCSQAGDCAVGLVCSADLCSAV